MGSSKHQRGSPSSFVGRAPGRVSQAPDDGSRRKRRRLNGPEPGSLYGIMRQNAGTALYVMPICWTDQHAQLLNAKWTQLPRSVNPTPTAAAKSHLQRPSVAASNLSRELTNLLSTDTMRPYAKLRAVKDVMSILYPDTMGRPRSAAELDIHVGSRLVKKAVRLQVVWKSPDAPINLTSFDSAETISVDTFTSQTSQPSQLTTQPASSQSLPDPLLAFISRSHLASIRQHLFRIVPHPREEANLPVTRLQTLRSKMLVPANADEDAHFVAIFVAMAQRQLYGETGSAASSQSSQASAKTNKFTPVFRDVKVQLLTTDERAAEFICYSAVVSEGLLRKFHSPYRMPRGATAEDGIDIKYTRVPIWPVLGLKERLGKALGRDVAGDIGEDDFETWGMEATVKKPEPVSPQTAQTSSSQSEPRSSRSSASSRATLSSLSSVSSSSSPRQGTKRTYEREPLNELLNKSFDGKDQCLSASKLASDSLTAALKSPKRDSLSVSLSLPASMSAASPKKRRRISEPHRRSTSEVNVSV